MFIDANVLSACLPDIAPEFKLSELSAVIEFFLSKNGSTNTSEDQKCGKLKLIDIHSHLRE